MNNSVSAQDVSLDYLCCEAITGHQVNAAPLHPDSEGGASPDGESPPVSEEVRGQSLAGQEVSAQDPLQLLSREL